MKPLTEEQLNAAREKFSAEVYARMKALDLTIEAMVEHTGLPDQQVKRVRNGKKNYTVDSYLRVVHVLDALEKKRRRRT